MYVRMVVRVSIRCVSSRTNSVSASDVCRDVTRLSQDVLSGHTFAPFRLGTRLETMIVCIETLYLEMQSAILPSKCLNTMKFCFEMGDLKKPRSVSIIFHLEKWIFRLKL